MRISKFKTHYRFAISLSYKAWSYIPIVKQYTTIDIQYSFIHDFGLYLFNKTIFLWEDQKIKSHPSKQEGRA